MSAALDIQLGRLDLASIGATRRHCLAVLPAGSKGKKQKIVTGGEDGVVQCFAVKKGETQLVFKNPPGKREVTALALGGPLGDKDRIYVAYGQTIQGVNKKKGQQFFLYATVLNEDIANLYVEDLSIYTGCEYSLNVFEASAKGDQVHDVHFYQAPDRIHHMAQLRLVGVGASGSKDSAYNSVLACQDKYLRVVRDSECRYEARVEGAVTAVATYDGPLPPERKQGASGGADLDPEALAVSAAPRVQVTADMRQVIYGTDNGLVGQYWLDAGAMKAGWTLGGANGADGGGVRKAGVSALTLLDVTLSGCDDVVVGRDDGTLEVFQYDTHRTNREPVFSRELNESITALAKGQVLANNSQDLLACTYSGKVLAFTHELKHSSVSHIAPKASAFLKEGTSLATAVTSTGLPGSIVGADGSSTNVMRESAADLSSALSTLRAELDKLGEKVVAAKEKYATKVSSELIAVEQQFKLTTSFKLLPREACYLLTVEIDLPLDCVTLQSHVPVMLLEGGGSGAAGAAAAGAGSGAGGPAAGVAAAPPGGVGVGGSSAASDDTKAILSRATRDDKHPNELLATYRVTESATRLEVKVRTVEGQHGALQVYVIPRVQPKTCQRAELKIKPLSLHEKVQRSDVADALQTRALSTLTLTGAFTLADVHAWVSFCLPEVSAKVAPQSDGGPALLYFRSTFLRTLLTAEYEKGRAVFRSDSVSAISILKEVMTKEATNRKVSITVDLDLSLPSISAFLYLLRPELDAHFTLARRAALVPALKEIATHELAALGLATDTSGAGGVAGSVAGGGVGIAAHLDQLSTFLQPSYVSILREADSLESRLAAAPRHLDFLRGIVTDLFVDAAKLQGKSAQARVPVLLEILENYSFDKLLQAFKE